MRTFSQHWQGHCEGESRRALLMFMTGEAMLTLNDAGEIVTGSWTLCIKRQGDVVPSVDLFALPLACCNHVLEAVYTHNVRQVGACVAGLVGRTVRSCCLGAQRGTLGRGDVDQDMCLLRATGGWVDCRAFQGNLLRSKKVPCVGMTSSLPRRCFCVSVELDLCGMDQVPSAAPGDCICHERHPGSWPALVAVHSCPMGPTCNGQGA